MSTASPAKPSRSERPQLSRLFPGRVATTIVLVCLVVMLLVRVFRDEMTILIKMFDTSAANLASLVLSLIIVLTLLVWFLCFSDYSSRTKAKAMMLLGACLALGFVGFQLDGPTGDMEFAFVPRTWLARLLPADAPPPPQSTDEKIDADLATTTTADFPRFLGPQGTNYLASAGGSPLSRDWTAKPPKLLWRQASGQGWSAFSAVNGFAVTLEQHGDDEWVTCYEVRTGKLVWTRVTPGRHEAAMGGIGPRSTPSIHQGRVYTIGGTGLLQCLDGKRGEVLWSDDLVRRCGSTPELEKIAIM